MHEDTTGARRARNGRSRRRRSKSTPAASAKRRDASMQSVFGVLDNEEKV